MLTMRATGLAQHRQDFTIYSGQWPTVSGSGGPSGADTSRDAAGI
jgi:hypothetical protein